MPDKLELTDPAPTQPSVLARWMKDAPQAGVYNNGLATLCAEPGIPIPEAWSFIPVGANGVIYAYTCDGNFYVAAETGEHCYFVVLQGRLVSDMYGSAAAIFDHWMDDEEAMDGFLNLERLRMLLPLHGPLTYGQCYTLAPLLILGGEERPENYAVRNFEVYIEIVSQTLQNNPLAVPEIMS